MIRDRSVRGNLERFADIKVMMTNEYAANLKFHIQTQKSISKNLNVPTP